MKTILTLSALASLLLATAAHADDKRRLGDHPAVVVQRLHKVAGYDYASKFYAHPAGLRLYMQQPRDEDDAASMATAGPGLRVTDATARRLGTDSLPQ
jgi:hypothetical protein